MRGKQKFLYEAKDNMSHFNKKIVSKKKPAEIIRYIFIYINQ